MNTLLLTYLAHLNDRAAPATLAKYKTTLTAFLEFLAPVREVDASPYDIQRWDDHLAASKLQPSTRRTYLAITAAYYAYLRLLGRVTTNPLAEYKRPILDEKIPTVAPVDVITKMIALCDANTLKGKRDAAAILLLFSTGMRPGELAALNQDDVNWDGDYLWVRIAAGKGRRERRLPLHPRTGLYYAHWIRSRTDQHRASLISFRAYRAHRTTKPISERALYNIIRDYSTAAGYKLTPKDARSTVATYLSNSDLTAWDLADWLGHTSPQTAEIYRRRYGHHLIAGAGPINPVDQIARSHPKNATPTPRHRLDGMRQRHR